MQQALPQPHRPRASFPRTICGKSQDFNTRKDNKCCKLSCCNRCTFCTRTLPKERAKSRGSRLSIEKKSQIKICEKCFLCHSIVLCPTCKQCPKCCTKTTCRARLQNLWQTWLDLGAGPKVVQTLREGYSLPFRTRPKLTRYPTVFQPTIFGPKTKQQVETHSRSEQVKSLPQGGEIQTGNTRNHQNLPSTRGVGHIHRFQRRLLPYPNTGAIQKVPQVSCPGPDISIQGPSLWSIHGTHGVYCGSKRGEVHGHAQGYKNPPVPRRLVGQSQVPPSLSPAYPNSGENLPRPWLASEFGKIRAGTKTGLQLCRLPVRSQVRSGPAHTGPVAEPTGKVKVTACTTVLSDPAVHVTDRIINSHRKTSSPRSVTYEAHPVASQKQLASTGITRKGHS